MIRVLIVDDSPTMRLMVRVALESDPEIQVVGEAMDGEQALSMAHRLSPDLITMDLQMPKINGFQAIERIMVEIPCPIIVLTSSKSDKELGISFQALEVGALAVISKPKGKASLGPDADHLIQQVKTLSQVKVVRRRLGLRPEPWSLPKPSKTRPVGGRELKIIAIGASTGGPPALQFILKNLSPDIGIPVVIVQHISAGFISGLVHWLDDTTPWRVTLAENLQKLQPQTAYLAPDGFHLGFSQPGQVKLNRKPPLGGHKPSATVLFQAVARVYRDKAIGVLLTGMGRDGADGLKTLRDSGSYTIAQDESSSVIFGMPKQAIEIDAAVAVLALNHIPTKIRSLAADGMRQTSC